jgi:hypothetical protein
VCIAGLRGQNQELTNSCPLLPGLDKFIHHTVQGTPTQRGSSREWPHCCMNAVLDGGSPGHPVRR